MRVGIMCHSSWGGSVRVATMLAAALAGRGHRVHVFARTAPFGRWPPPPGASLHLLPASVQGAAPPASLVVDWPRAEIEAFLDNLLRVIRAEGLDVLHFHYALPFAFIAAELRRRLGVGAPLLVGTLHGTDVSTFGQDVVIRRPLARALRQMDRLTTVSASHARLAAGLLELSPPPSVIPNFVDGAQFRPSRARRRGRDQAQRVRIVHLSNFRPVKDSRSVAHIFIGIREHLDAELWLIGDGPELGAVRALLDQAACAGDVRSWGLQADPARLLAQADACPRVFAWPRWRPWPAASRCWRRMSAASRT
jgi:glycosyltransferase involved in cell wall biosynthesis